MADNYLSSYETCKSCYYGTGPCNNSSNYCLSSYEPSSSKSCYYGSDLCINSSNYDQIVVPFEHDSFSYSYELNNPDLINYDNLISTQFDISHSSHRFSQPNLSHYYPINHGYSSISNSSYLMNHISETETNHHVVAASVVVADDDDFLEYDPTPYGGGYDQVLTYGEPLQASNKICHPRSTFSVDPIDIVNSSPDYNDGHDSSLGKPISREEDRRKPVNIDDRDEEKCFEIVAEKSLDLGTGRSGEMGQFLPYGYGLEAMDLCESLFGYWPCLSKELRRKPQDQEKEEDAEQEEGYDQYWSYAQDYIFGSSSPYG